MIAMAARRRFLLPTVLGATAVATGGMPGYLAGFAALLLAVDRALDLAAGRGGSGGAEQAYRRVARERRRAERRRRLRQLPPDGLEYLAEDTGLAALSRRRRIGVETIALESVVGSVDRHKATTFDRRLRPPEWSRVRWTQMYLASQRGTQMPPISVYRLGSEHFLRDGHHRASVSRALGASGIDADVVELQPPAA